MQNTTTGFLKMNMFGVILVSSILFISLATLFSGMEVQRLLNPPVKCVAFDCPVAHCDCKECKYVMTWEAGETAQVKL